MAYTTVDDASLLNNAVLWTGNDTAQTISGVGFTENLLWTAGRSISGVGRTCHDTVRGAPYQINMNSTASEANTPLGISAFTADGFSVGSENSVNDLNQTYVGWNWKAGTTTGLSGGSITPSGYSINTTAKFGIYEFTGTAANATIAHGLGAVPTGMIFKNLSTTDGWHVYNVASGNGYVSYLNSTAVADASSTAWNSTTPDATNFTIGTAGGVNGSGNSIIAYVWCDVPGYSKMGGYTGTTSADGPFIYTGFKPSFVLTKPWNYTQAWSISDNKRPGYGNPIIASDESIDINTTNGTVTEARMNLVSNGFKLNSGAAEVNAAYNYMYWAFAESPCVNSSGVPCNGR
tara:strand:+ start:1902 stop:2942 length:1041 start_codon:yes stop_codon:yes gene_type:complete